MRVMLKDVVLKQCRRHQIQRKIEKAVQRSSFTGRLGTFVVFFWCVWLHQFLCCFVANTARSGGDIKQV